METKHEMKIVICPNDKCKTPIRLSEGRFLGGENDIGGVVIECEVCKTVFPCRLKNPYDISRVIKNGKKLDDWTDDMPDFIARKYNVSQDQLDNLDISLVFGYEPPPKISWEPSDLPLYFVDNVNLEQLAKQELFKYKNEINDNYRAYYNLYVKGGHSADKSFVIVNYEYQGTTYKAVFAKKIDNERDLHASNLYLIYHSGVNIEYQVDGIYARDQLLVFLERFLNRWRYSAMEVLLIVPFIGFNYKNSEDALYQLWNWLEINVDISKTKLITRKGTFNLFKNAQDSTGLPFEELVKLGLLEPLIDKMNQKDTEYFQNSHAKYYVGVFESYVEVLSGSFNIHQGKYFENINFRKYDKTFFKERYLHMFKGFEYAINVKDEYVHYMTFGTKDNKNYLTALNKLLGGFE